MVIAASQFLLLPRASTSLFYPLNVWMDEIKLVCMGPEWWESQYKKIVQLDATLLTIGVANETVMVREDGEPVTKPKGDIIARKKMQARRVVPGAGKKK